MREFDIIQQYLVPLTRALPGADNLCDDGATLSVPPGYALVVTTDSLHAGTHFIGDEDPGDIARKALRVNLSDLAAMGADPLSYQLGLSLPEDAAGIDAAWLKAFTDALAAEQDQFHVTLSGGDLTSCHGPLSITITAMGLVPEGKGVPRHGAQDGDHVVLAGPVGDAAAGLAALRHEFAIDHESAAALIAQYRVPVINTAIASAVRDYANAAIDISDGLHADLQHICKASHISADIYTDTIPLSPACATLLRKGELTWADIVSGGDDYKLLLAVPDDTLSPFMEAARTQGLNSAVIGQFIDAAEHEPAVTIHDSNGGRCEVMQSGWRHF